MEEMITYLSVLGDRNHQPGYNGTRADLAPYIYSKTGYDAVHHLFRVVTGLDSLVQGDHQVAGQVSRSFQALANVDKPADPVLSRMFHVAFRTGRTARKESGLGWSQVSIPSFGVKLLEREIWRPHRQVRTPSRCRRNRTHHRILTHASRSSQHAHRQPITRNAPKASPKT